MAKKKVVRSGTVNTATTTVVKQPVEEVSLTTVLHLLKEIALEVTKIKEDIRTLKFNIQQVGMRR